MFNHQIISPLLIAALLSIVSACWGSSVSTPATPATAAAVVERAPLLTPQPAATEQQPQVFLPTVSAAGSTPRSYTSYSYEVVASYPHDTGAFTQGLIVVGENFYEGTGWRGQSTLREVDIESGAVLRGVRLPDQYFGEGITLFEGKVYQLTWQSQIGFIFDAESFELLDTFAYSGEGWGLTHDGNQLIMSDGSDFLTFLDPATLEPVGRVAVVEQGVPVSQLNELEYIDGLVYANIWRTDRIVMIDPQSGEVVGSIDLQGIIDPAAHEAPFDVLNGIAYDERTDRLFVTGKYWPTVFQIRLIAHE